VKFRVSWNAATAANNRVWVWVDFCSVAGTTPGTFAPATITSASVTSGAYTDLNGRGFFVTANGATVTAALGGTTGQFNWCAYGSDYPPNIGDYNDGTYTLRGTPPFTLKDANGNTQIVAGTTIAQSSLNIIPVTMTDETGCPGYFCKYVGMDLHLNASYPCQQRASGAKNWEAWIKDTRDHELYRIVLMPDKKWWLAQNVKYADVGSAISGCTKEECGKAYTWAQIYASYAGGSSGSTGNVQGICPPGWLLPTRLTYAALAGTFNSGVEFVAALRPLNNVKCTPKTDPLGWASKFGIINGNVYDSLSAWYTNDIGREDGIVLDEITTQQSKCGEWSQTDNGESSNLGVVRCYYQP
jgi:uncharacterized protein (TIGR02145 family)